ncbi:MAG: nucleotide exchange factor GrpE [Candidatus Paceibacterota bacterium]
MGKNDQKDDVIYENDKKTASDDVVMEEEAEAPEMLVKKLKEKIKMLEKEKQEYMNGWQRERADLINYKKRVESEKLEVIKYSNENLISELISVLDSFEMAFANKEAWEKADKNWRVGVEYIHSQFLKILDENGLKIMNPLGEKFDPRFHVAEAHVETKDEKQDGIIVSVKKKGYMLNGRAIVPSQVSVGEFKK